MRAPNIYPDAATLDQKIAALVHDVDDEFRSGLKTRLRALREGAPGEHIAAMLVMARWTLRLLDLLFATVDKKRPSDNAYDCIITAATGDGKKVTGLRIVPSTVASFLHTIRILSNKADHAKDLPDTGARGQGGVANAQTIETPPSQRQDSGGEEIIRLTARDAENALSLFLRVLEWFYCEYERGPRLLSLYGESEANTSTIVSGFPALELDPQTSSTGALTDTPLFVGRQAEISALLERGKHLESGQGACAFVLGEAGVGKSALVAEFARRHCSEHPGTRVFWGRCDMQSGRVSSCAPFKSIMEQILLSDAVVALGGRVVRPIDVVAEVIVSYGGSELGVFSAFTGIATERLRCVLRERAASLHGQPVGAFPDQAAVFDWFCTILRSVAGRFPLVLVLDDVHWADESSLLLLLHLGLQVARCPLLVVATYRPEGLAVDSLLPDVRNKLVRVGAFAVSLETLPKEAASYGNAGDALRQFCREYLTAKYQSVLSEELVDSLVSLTRGNALFLSEILINLEELGYLVRSKGQWCLAHGAADIKALPARIEAVICERLQRLDEETLALLKRACVEGQTFTAQALTNGERADERIVLKAISEQLVRRHQLVCELGMERLPNGSRLNLFRFNHVLVQRYAYDQVLTDTERSLLHEEIALRIESLWQGSVANVAPQLATHFVLAGAQDKAVEYCLMAARSGLDQNGWSEVTRFARLGLDACGEELAGVVRKPRPEVLELRLLYAKGELEGGVRGETTDHVQNGVASLQGCLSLTDSVGAPLAADICLTLGRLLAVGRKTTGEKVHDLFARALELYERLGDKRGVIAVLSPCEFDSNPAIQGATEAQFSARMRCLELAEELGDPLVLSRCLNNLAEYFINFDTNRPEPLAEADVHARRSLQIARNCRNPILELNALLMTSWVHHHLGQYGAELKELRQRIVALARKHGQMLLEAEAITDLAHYCSFFVDSQDVAERLMQEARELRVRMGRHAIIDCEQFSELLLRQGRFSQSISLLREALERDQDAFRALRTRGQIALILVLTGAADQARAEMERIEVREVATPSLTEVLSSKRALAYALLDERVKATAEAFKIEGKIDRLGQRGLFHTYTDYPTELAEIYRLLGRPQEAQRWSEVASSYWSRLACVTEVEKLIMFWEFEVVRAKVLAAQGEHKQALAVLGSAQVPLASAGHHLQAELLLVMGKSLRALDDEVAAEATLKKSVEVARRFSRPQIEREARGLLEAGQ